MTRFIEGPSESSPLDMAVAGAERLVKDLDKELNRFVGLVQPSTPLGRVRKFFARGPLRGVLLEDPLDTLQSEYKRTANDLGRNVGIVLTEGRARIEHAGEVDSLIQKVEGDPEDRGSLGALRHTIRERADQELDLRLTPDAQKLFDEQLTPHTPEEEEAERQRILTEARLHRDIAAPVVATLEALTPQAVRSLDELMGMYSLVAEYRASIKVAESIAEHLKRTGELGILTLGIMELKMKHAIAVAQVAGFTREVYHEAQRIYPQRMVALTDEARQLMPPSN